MDNTTFCTMCDYEISDRSLLVITDSSGNRVCSEDCQAEADFDIGRDQTKESAGEDTQTQGRG